MGTATAISDDNTTSSIIGQEYGWIANSQCGGTAEASAMRPSSKLAQAASGSMAQLKTPSRTQRTIERGRFRNKNGPKSHTTSLLGITCRTSPAIKPTRAAMGADNHSWLPKA